MGSLAEAHITKALDKERAAIAEGTAIYVGERVKDLSTEIGVLRDAVAAFRDEVAALRAELAELHDEIEMKKAKAEVVAMPPAWLKRKPNDAA